MESFMSIIDAIEAEYGTGVLFITPLLLFIGAVAKWKLFVKCNQPGIGAILPIYDVVLTMRIVGRPGWHAILFFTPAVIYMVPKILIELAQSFGKRTVLDYILAIVFSLFYVLNLGLAYDAIYSGPVYGEKKHRASNPQLT